MHPFQEIVEARSYLGASGAPMNATRKDNCQILVYTKPELAAERGAGASVQIQLVTKVKSFEFATSM